MKKGQPWVIVVISILLLQFVAALYWEGTVWDTDPKDGKNDFNPENNPYYINTYKNGKLDKWYWCEDNNIMMTTQDAPDSWIVERCDDKCHSTRAFRTSAKDINDYQDVTWCGSTVAENVCSYPYGKGYQCNGNTYYKGLCEGKTDNQRCDNCVEYLGSVKCDSTSWAYCLNKKIDNTNSLIYVCDYSSSGVCQGNTVKKFVSSKPLELVLEQCEKEASNLNNNNYAWQFDSDLCECVYAPKKIGVASYDSNSDCWNANKEIISDYKSSNECKADILKNVPAWLLITFAVIVLLMILAIFFVK